MGKAEYGSRKKIHYLYKTVNKVNGKFYYGMHSTNSLEDGYIGSGKLLRQSIRKYGRENFEITIISFYNSREELKVAEKDLITEEILKDQNCYNLQPGGGGGGLKNDEHAYKFHSAGGRAVLRLLSQRHQEKLKVDPEYRDYYCSRVADGVRDAHKKRGHGTFKGRAHSEITKKKMSEAKRDKGTGKDNSQFGTMWITNGINNKKIKKDEIVPTGWRKGRIFG